MTNVQPLIHRAALSHSRKEIMDVVRDELYASGDLKPIAEGLGLSVGTLYAIRSGRTQWPRHTTLFSLLPALGLGLYVRKIR